MNYTVWAGNTCTNFIFYANARAVARALRQRDNFIECEIDIFSHDGRLLASKKAGNKNFWWRKA